MEIKIIPEFEEELQKITNIGKQLATDKSILFLSLARNCANNLDKRLDAIENIGLAFKKYAWMIYENDSIDNTNNIIKQRCDKNKILISENIGATHPTGPLSKSKIRTEALASYRNKLKNIAGNTFNDYDIVCVIDADFKGIIIDNIYNSLYWMDINNSISAMAGFALEIHSNNKITNYDSWAYRHTWWSDQQHTMIWFYNWVPLIGSHPYKVNSAFGGSCLYKSNFYFGGCDYEGYDCEHVCFHKNLYNKFNNFSLYVNPSQLMIM